LPAAKDDENLPIIFSCFEKYKSSLPSFITFDSDSTSFSLNPISGDKAGKYIIQVDLSDSLGASKSYWFEVIVIEAIKNADGAGIQTEAPINSNNKTESSQS
jgi:hypothetical protein